MKALASSKSYIFLAVLIGVGIIGVASLRIHDTAGNSRRATHATRTTSSANKHYCDSTVHACFTYPAGWPSPEVLSTGTVSFGDRFGDAKHTLGGELNILPQQTTTTSTFYTVATELVSGGKADTTLVGGYYTDGPAVTPGKATTVPAYYLVDSGLANQYGFAAGLSRPAPANLGMNTPDGKAVRFVCGASTGSADQGWFNSAAALTCKKLLRSFSFQQ